MNRINENSWRAGLPSFGFADATVERMLDGGMGPTVVAPRYHRVTWLFVAALFVSGAALGVALQGGTRQTTPVNPNRTMASALPETEKVPVTLASAPQASVAPVVSKRRVAQKTFTTMPKTTASAVVPPVPKVPGCGCERGFGDYLCDCY